MSSFRIAACQMAVCADLESNRSRISNGIAEASKGGARLVAFPECAVSGYPPLHHLDPSEIDLTRVTETNALVTQAAAEHKIWVIFGTILKSPDEALRVEPTALRAEPPALRAEPPASRAEPPALRAEPVEARSHLRNSALVISDTGEIKARYDKLHLMPNDKPFFAPGNELVTFDFDGLTCGVTICYDARFPEPFRALRGRGAKLIINISNACGSDTWKMPVLEGTYRTRASENSVFLVAVNAAGPEQMAVSRICDPLGLDLAFAKHDREEMLFADIDPAQTDTGYYYDRRADLFER